MFFYLRLAVSVVMVIKFAIKAWAGVITVTLRWLAKLFAIVHYITKMMFYLYGILNGMFIFDDSNDKYCC